MKWPGKELWKKLAKNGGLAIEHLAIRFAIIMRRAVVSAQKVSTLSSRSVVPFSKGNRLAMTLVGFSVIAPMSMLIYRKGQKSNSIRQVFALKKKTQLALMPIR